MVAAASGKDRECTGDSLRDKESFSQLAQLALRASEISGTLLVAKGPWILATCMTISQGEACISSVTELSDLNESLQT